MLKQEYDRVLSRLNRVNMGALWPGFRRYPFALYDARNACVDGEVLPRPEDFRGNTAIPWRGGYMAIWDVGMNPVADADVLAGHLTHEMFHAHQLTAGETRFPDDLRLLCHPPTAEALALRQREHGLLARAAERPGPEKAAGLLGEVFALRALREACCPEDARQGFLTETVEGTAEWVGLSALAQLSPEKAAQRLRQTAVRLAEAGPHQLDTRRVSYDSGVCLLALARLAELPLPAGQEESISAQLAAQLPTASPAPLAPEEAAYWASVLARQREQRRALLAGFRARPLRRLSGPFRLCGYDPMNMWRQDDSLYGTSFFLLEDGTGRQLPLGGETLLTMAHGSADRVLWAEQAAQEPGQSG
ncbi:MAG: hypothetical protein ACI4ML_02665 [Aristaeellaceae bacterium]